MARRQKETEAAEAVLETAIADRGEKAATGPVTKRRTLATRTRSSTRPARSEAAEPAAQSKTRNLKVVRPPTKTELFQERVERLENGMRLLAETFKRAFGELNASMEQLRADVAQTATPADVDRAVARTATPADVAQGAARAVQPLVSSLDQLMRKAPSSSPALQEAMFRLMEGIDAAEAIVAKALNGDAGPPADEDPVLDAVPNGDKATDRPDASAIWGGDGGAAASDLKLSEADRQRHSQARRRLAHSWPSRAYANWKYRRSELS